MDEIQYTFKDTKSKNKIEQENNDSIKKKEIIDKCIELDHDELVKLTKEAIHNIIESDPLLSGLPADVTFEEIKAQIAVAQGQAITLYLNRGELPKLGIVVIHFLSKFLYYSYIVYQTFTMFDNYYKNYENYSINKTKIIKNNNHKFFK
ncbi:hypothetical protein WN48_03455 [Eufriesea mexicana]|nr:hypothetical protein WN48_03455 [Eufriesea mexicana]